jgi:hypothetical protein
VRGVHARGHDVRERLSHQLFFRPPQQARRGAVDVDDALVRIGGDDAVGEGLQHAAVIDSAQELIAHRTS